MTRKMRKLLRWCIVRSEIRSLRFAQLYVCAAAGAHLTPARGSVQDESAPQMVLAPTFTGNDRARWRRADRKVGEGTTVNLDDKGASEVSAITRAFHGEAR